MTPRKKRSLVEKSILGGAALGLLLIGVGVVIYALNSTADVPEPDNTASISNEKALADSEAMKAAVEMRNVCMLTSTLFYSCDIQYIILYFDFLGSRGDIYH